MTSLPSCRQHDKDSAERADTSATGLRVRLRSLREKSGRNLRSIAVVLAVSFSLWAAPASAQTDASWNDPAIKTLIERLKIEAAGRTNPDTRARLETELKAVKGAAARVDNSGGILLVLRGYPWEAIWFFAESATENPNQADVLNNMGLALILLGKHDDAEQLLLYVTERWPDFYPAWTNLARLYCDLADYTRAQEALEKANAAEPGTTGAEELALRIAVERGQSAAAARHAVNVGNLDPTNPMLAMLRPHISESEIAHAVENNIEAVPLPEIYVELEAPIDQYEEFVLDEMNRHYWNTLVTHFAEAIDSRIEFQEVQLPSRASSQLPPQLQQAAALAGVFAGTSFPALAPAGSRANYTRLSMYMKRYQDYYISALKRAYLPVKETLREQGRRTRQLARQHGGYTDPGIRAILSDLNAAHPRFLAQLAEARTIDNRLTRRHWRTMAGLISMVPEEYRREEIGYLHLQASLGSQMYAGNLLSWHFIGLMPVAIDRAMADIMASELHAAAAERQRAALAARAAINTPLEPELDTHEEIDLSDLAPWLGPNLGAFAIKVQDELVAVSGGEVIVGDMFYNWEQQELELGIGLGGGTPPLGGVAGMSGKVLGVVRLGGRHGAALGVRELAQASIGTPLGGVDYNLINDYQWILSAGRPHESLLGF